MSQPKTFRDLGVRAELCDALETQGIVHPFPIQELTLPLALDGADLIGQARTGTGKTLAFGLPLLQRIDPDRTQTQALVVVPTRELCLQVHDDLSIGSELGVRTIAVYGGVGYDEQIEALTSGVHVVVGTPGRLLDHLNRGNLDLSGISELVLDEADEMLDMGFLPDVERLIEACSQDRHSMLFSATMPTAIVKLARRYLDHPTYTRAESEQRETAPTVEQHFFQVHRMDKPRVLARVLQSPGRGGVYVFVRTKAMADRLVSELDDLGVQSIAIHGDLRQSTRERNMDRFRDQKVDVLVATEVAARGLDVENVTHVINYDCPEDEKMYLHRIGRTARAGASGVAITFAEFNEIDRLNVIRKAVAAETAIEQVFSTSDHLKAVFGLPDETPWAHLATSGASGRDRDGDRRRGSSDGRSKNRPTTRDRDATRTRGGSGRRSRDDDDRTTTSESERGSSRRDAADRRERASGGSGGRTRARRERPATRERTTAEPEVVGEPALPGDDEVVTARVRTRTRSQEATSAPSRGSGGQRRRSTGERARSDEASDRSPSTQRRDRGRSSEDRDQAASGSDRNGRGGDDRRGRASGGRDGRSRRDPGRPDAGESRDAGDRDTTSRRVSGDRGEDQRPGEAPAARGRDARGDGTPQPSRRVKVEHLP